MNLPVIEKISRHIVDTLKGVQEAAGWNVSLKVVRRRKRGHVVEHMLAIVEQQDPTKVGDDGAEEAAGWIGWLQPYVIEVYCNPSEDDDRAIDEIINLARADVEKVLTQDDDSTTRGGLAIDTSVEEPELFDDVKGTFAGVRVRVTVYYRTLVGDPYNLQP